MKKKHVTMEAVAKKSGVSSMTVSRVIRGEPMVKDETRARVVKAMRDLGYVPSAAAQSLRSRDLFRSAGRRLFALVFGQGTESSVTFFHDIMRGVEKAASEFGLCPIQVALQESPELSWLRLQSIISIGSLCGALLVGQFSPEDIRFIRKHVRNAVVVDGPAPAGEGAASVESGNVEGSLMAIDYLIGAGCRSLCLLTVDKGHYFARAMEFAASLRRSALTEIKTTFGCSTSHEAHDMVLNLWERGERFDGMFTNDDFAIGALKAFRKLHVEVPGELKVVGFDDILYASFTSPTLTSVRIDKFLLGAEAVRTLVAMTHSKEEAIEMKKVIQPTLVIRESTGGPAPAG